MGLASADEAGDRSRFDFQRLWKGREKVTSLYEGSPREALRGVRARYGGVRR
jgi:hypothetical protein